MSSEEEVGLTIASLLVLLLSVAMVLGGALWAFILALRSGKLSTMGMVWFGLVLVCGIGIIPAIGSGWSAVTKGVFERVANGEDPLAVRGVQTQYKIAAALVIVGAIAGLFFR